MLAKSVAIVGATGYTGLELCRLLSGHPDVSLTRVFSSSKSGNRLSDLYPNLTTSGDLTLESYQPGNCLDLDLIFLALPHGASQDFLSGFRGNCKIIDLSADFRIRNADVYHKYYDVDHRAWERVSDFVYGLSEIYGEEISKSDFVANPGCYSTCSLLPLIPLVQAKLVHSSIVIDAKSGVSGAGKSLKESSLFCEISESFTAYGTGIHRHQAEIEQELDGQKVFFSPHLIPANRGMLASIYIDQVISEKVLQEVLQSFYKDQPFVRILSDMSSISTKWVRNSNMCFISYKVFPDQNKTVLYSVIDNLVKGASGQAVQNMNLMFGFDQSAGLNIVASHI